MQSEAVLTSTHNLCCRAEIRNISETFAGLYIIIIKKNTHLFFRLSAALTGGKAIDLINAACSEQGLLSLYQVGIPGDSTQARVGAVDSVSQRIIELYQPALLQQYVPLSVLGDGNCFYRSISRALCGHENLHILLRLKTAIEIIVNRKYYDTERRSYVDLIRDHRIIVSDYKKLVEDTVILGSYSEMMHIYALSAVLNTPIRSFYPPQIHPELASDAFSRMVVGRNVRGASSSNITIMWTQMCIPQNAKRFSPNHFVFLKEIGQSAPVQVVVVDDNEQEDIKIKENIRQKKKTQLSDSKSFKITAHSEQSEAETPGQIDIVTTSNNDSLSASTVSMPEPQVSCNFENSLSVQKLDDRHKNTNYGDEGNKLPLSNANAHDNNSSVYGKDDYSSICFTDLEEASDLSWKSEKTDETKDSKSETSEHNVSMQSGSDNEDEIVGFQSNNIDASDLKNECKGNIPNGKHLETDRVIDLLMKADIGLKSIPCGLKENVFFIIDNENNISKKEKDQKSVFYDDCGVWDSGSGMSPKTPYLLTCSGRLKKLYLRVKEGSTLDNHDEETERVYCFERQIKKKRVYEPLNPQPKQGEVVTVQRYYVSLSLDKSYKKRVTYLWEGKLKSKFALVEYTGKFPGLSAHGNTKSGDDEYIRTPPAVMEEMAEMLKTDKPSIVFNKLKRKYDEVSRPSSLHQIRNKKRREKMKETNNANGNNVADQIQALENLVSKDHHFVRTIIRDKNKTPTIILYNDEQILDVKNLCCTGQSVLGVDKTFNLCNMHVTVSCYKQRSVVRTRTAESPIFLGPIFIHDNSDFESFGNFFYHLKMKLIDSDLQNLVIGTDDEKAMVKAIKTAFPESTHVLCSRHN